MDFVGQRESRRGVFRLRDKSVEAEEGRYTKFRFRVRLALEKKSGRIGSKMMPRHCDRNKNNTQSYYIPQHFHLIF